MAKIKKISARQILDSQGHPTIEAHMVLDSGHEVTAVSPSGQSLGKYEALELRDGGSAYEGLGVTKGVSYINDLIGPKLIGADPSTQVEIDEWLKKADTTQNTSQLGVNTIMTVSQLAAKAAAAAQSCEPYVYLNNLYTITTSKKIPIEKIPSLIVTVINGGKHGNKNLEFQEFQIIPATSYSYSHSLEFAVESYHNLRKVLSYRNAGISVSDEGGFVPNLLTNIDALEVIKESLMQCKKKLGVDVHIGLDMAASQYFSGGKYIIKDRPQPLSTQEYIDYLAIIVKEYSILFLEDPLEQENFAAWESINEKLGTGTYIAGDDFIAGKKERLVKAISDKDCSAVVIKFNQVATITDILELVAQAKESNMKIVFSHRLGESNDSIIADFAVAIQSDFVKFGAPVRGERVAKYNRLLAIEKELHMT